jgi:hypothetical protein
MRSRNVKPGLFTNETLAECSFAARYLFIGLWCAADREGRLEDRPKRIKATLLPYDSVDADELLSELERNGFVKRYEVDGGRYIEIPAFAKHQSPHPNEVASTIPKCPRPSKIEAVANCNEDSRNVTRTREKESSTRADSRLLIPESRDARPEAATPEPEKSAAKLARKEKPKAEKKPRARDELFDAVAEITASDPTVSGGHVAKVANLLRQADPPYSAAEGGGWLRHGLCSFAPSSLRGKCRAGASFSL